MAGLIATAGIVWAYFYRRKPLWVTLVGGAWSVIGGVWIWMGQPIGFGFAFTGMVCLVWGGINLWRDRHSAPQSPV